MRKGEEGELGKSDEEGELGKSDEEGELGKGEEPELRRVRKVNIEEG